MKINKRFEEILREKLENINPAFEEDDWLKFNRYQGHMASRPGLATYLPWLAVAASVVAVVFAGSLYFEQRKQNKLLLTEISQLRENFEKTEQEKTPLNTDEELPGESSADVYENDEMTGIGQSGQTEGNISLPFAHERELTVNTGIPEEVAGIREKWMSPVPEEGSLLSNLSDFQDKTWLVHDGEEAEKVVFTAQPLESIKSYFKQPEHLSGNRLGLQIHVRQNTYATVTKRSVSGTENKDGRQIAGNPAADAGGAKVGDNKNILKLPGNDKVERTAAEEKALPDFISSRPYRIGILQKVEKTFLGTATVLEVLIGKNFSAGTGFAWGNHRKKKYGSESQFKKANHLGIREISGVPLPPSTFIFNISEQSEYKQIPVFVSYRGDLGKNFNYFIKAETGFNLVTRQHTSFDFKYPNPVNQIGRKEIELKRKAPLLGNSSLGAGIEMRWGHVGTQFEGYYAIRGMKESLLMKRDSGPGISARLFYQFGE